MNTTVQGGVSTADQAAGALQSDPELIVWRIHFSSPPDKVYAALATAEGRKSFWAESAEERDGTIRYLLPGGLESTGRILQATPDRRFVAEYFGWTVTFDLEADGSGGTDFTMTCRGVSAGDRVEVIAGWVSVLMAMKAAVDLGADLRNPDPERTWWQGYADN